jgi:thiol-disulfide isomerase/thioredoxin
LLSVKIENPTGDSLFIASLSTGEVLEAIFLDNGELAKDTIILPIGYYRIGDGTETSICFLKPNYDLNLTLNTAEFDESIKYSGLGSYENNYLAEKYLLEEGFAGVNYYGYYANLEEEDFLFLEDSLYNLNNDLFNKHKPNFDEDFSKIEFSYLKTDYLIKLANYESMRRFFTNNDEFRVSSKFPNPFTEINMEDEMLLIVPQYVHYINLYLQDAASNKLNKNDTLTYYNTLIGLMDSELKNKKVKEKIAYDFGKYSLSYVEDPSSCYDQLMKMISNPEYIKEIDELYAKLKRIEKGAISPTFELYDIDSNLVKLEDFKGKFVYIDIWSTWCAPCIKEIPELDKLQTEFKDKNIVFISICENDDKERWRATVVDNGLQGIHLFVPDADNKFLTDYLVSGVPRFILIDENGFIIESKAPQPSSPLLKEQLYELL